MKFLTFALTLLLGVDFAMAAGTGPGSLIAPATNVTILLVVFIIFLRKPLRSFFSSKSSAVSEMVERASSKAKEAEAMMEIQKKKTSAVDDEIKKLETESEGIIREFEAKYKNEVEARIVAMKEDAGLKIEAEKKQLLEELNSDLLDLVINKAKTQIKADGSLSGTATNKLLEGL